MLLLEFQKKKRLVFQKDFLDLKDEPIYGSFDFWLIIGPF